MTTIFKEQKYLQISLSYQRKIIILAEWRREKSSRKRKKKKKRKNIDSKLYTRVHTIYTVEFHFDISIECLTNYDAANDDKVDFTVDW